MKETRFTLLKMKLLKMLVDAGAKMPRWQYITKNCPKCGKNSDFISSKLEEQIYCSVCAELVDEVVTFMRCKHATCCVKCVEALP